MSSYAASYASSYAASYASTYGENDPCDGGHRRLGGGGNDGCGAHTLTLFDFAFASRSDYVVYSFILIVAFSVTVELLLEHIEEHSSDVYIHVLQKLYKELMLLGLISFGLFIIQFSFEDLDIDVLHSFEFAHFVMFFVGVLLILQTSWSCFCNHQIKKRVWIGCSRDYQKELKPHYESLRAKYYFPFTTTFHYIQMQLFRILFLDVFDLPHNFSYPHYFNKSLDAHTVELVDVQWGSYVWVLCCVIASEFLVRYFGPSAYAEKHGEGRVVDDTESVYIFFSFGGLICLSYLLLYRACRRALMKVLKVKFGCEHISVIGRSLEYKIRQREEYLAESTRRGGARKHKRRDIQDVQKSLRPFTDPSFFEGIEFEEHLKQQSQYVDTDGSASLQEDHDKVKFSVDTVPTIIIPRNSKSEVRQTPIIEAAIESRTKKGLKNVRGSIERMLQKEKPTPSTSHIELPSQYDGMQQEFQTAAAGKGTQSTKSETYGDTLDLKLQEHSQSNNTTDKKRNDSIECKITFESNERDQSLVGKMKPRESRSISDTVAMFNTKGAGENIRGRRQNADSNFRRFLHSKTNSQKGGPYEGHENRFQSSTLTSFTLQSSDIKSSNKGPSAAKSKVGAERMIRHAGANRRLRRNSMVKRKLDSTEWQADAIIECFEAELPFRSITILRKLIDCVRFTSNFYLALYFTIFSNLWSMKSKDPNDDLEYGLKISSSDSRQPLAVYLALFSFLPVMTFNLVAEPYVSVQYSTICTMSCINPLLLGETVAHVNETTKMFVKCFRTILVESCGTSTLIH